jgi:hypothetical protein
MPPMAALTAMSVAGSLDRRPREPNLFRSPDHGLELGAHLVPAPGRPLNLFGALEDVTQLVVCQSHSHMMRLPSS